MQMDSLKANIEAGFLADVLPKNMISGLGLRTFRDMIQVTFKEKVTDSVRVQVGSVSDSETGSRPVFRVRPGLVVGYSLNVKKSIGNGLVFTWKNMVKPAGFIEIQNRILGLYTQKL